MSKMTKLVLVCWAVVLVAMIFGLGVKSVHYVGNRSDGVASTLILMIPLSGVLGVFIAGWLGRMLGWRE